MHFIESHIYFILIEISLMFGGNSLIYHNSALV